MRNRKILFALCLLCGLILGCSSSNNCSERNNYRLEYFSSGGFTGIERGITIECNGLLKKWERKLNSKAEIIDSFMLDSSTMQNMEMLITNNEIFSYKLNKSGNFTATLILSMQDKKNIISFNPADLPSDFPQSIKAILLEIDRINKLRATK